MSYLALARKWRPKQFCDVIGQAHVVSALSNALDNQRVHHAFLFTGTRGVGKTTLARIFAKALNCENGVSATPCGDCVACRGVDQGNFVDLIEVDAASRTKVDDTRELLDNVQYTPTQGRFKVYLIDEVHMLSTHSFNALLKTLEEPPDHVKFLLATTNPQKLPTTILSRCIQFNLKAVDISMLSAQLEKILVAEEISFDPAALTILSRSANGSVRDALSLLDQAIAFSNSDVNSEQVRSMLGMIDDQYILQICEQVIDSRSQDVLQTIVKMAERSVDYAAALDEILTLIHNIALFQVSPASLEWKGIDSTPFKELAGRVDAETVQLLYQIALMGKRDLDYAPDQRSGFEMVLLRMLAFQPDAINKQRKNNLNTKGISAGHDQTSSTVQDVQAKYQADPDKAVHSADVGEITRETNISSTVSVIEASVTEIAQNGSIDLNDFMGADGWKKFIDHSGLGGISKEILMNMVPKSVEGTTVNLIMDSASRHLFNKGRLEKIENHCQDKLSLKVSFRVEVNDFDSPDIGNETPTQQHSREQREKASAATQAFIHDQNVQQIVEQFDAEIVTGSIRPG